MNYYEHHLGDYTKKTDHLSALETGVYRLLLDRYYGAEEGIPEQHAERYARARTETEKEALILVLNEFFTLENGIWINKRCEEEIEKARKRIKTARKNGKAGGRPAVTQEEPSNNPVGFQQEPSGKALHTPLPTTHTPVSSVAKATDKPSSLSGVGLVNETARQELFGLVQPIAKQFSLSEGRTRGIFGRAVKLSGNDHAAIVDLVRRAQHGPPMELEPWLMAACKPKDKIIYGAELTDADLEGHPQYRYRAHAKVVGSAQGG